MNVVTIDEHACDVVEGIVRENIENAGQFAWVS